jgi:hypothetical protein
MFGARLGGYNLERSAARKPSMALTDEQRAELEALGPETVRAKLIQGGPGHGASVAGFKSGHPGGLGGLLTRGDVEDWLAEKHGEEARERKQTLRWATIAAWAGIAGVIATVIIGIASIIVTIKLSK